MVQQSRLVVKTVLAFAAVLMICSLTAVAAEKVKVVWMNWYSTGFFAPYQERIIAEYEKQNPNIDVEMVGQAYTTPEQFLLMNASGDAPDIMWVTDFELAWYRRNNLVQDLKYFNDKNPVDVDQWVPVVKQTATADGGLWGVPFDFPNIQSVLYNHDIFDAAGVRYPADNWTWDDYLALAAKLTKMNSDGTFAQLGATIPMFAIPVGSGFMHTFGGSFVTPDGKDIGIDQPGSLKAYTYIREFVRQVANFNRITVKFPEGKVAIGWAGTCCIAQTMSTATSNFAWSSTVTPRGPNGRFVLPSHSMWVVPKGAKHAQEAWNFIQFANDDWAIKVYAEAGRIPPRIPMISLLSEKQLGIPLKEFTTVWIEQLVQHGFVDPAVPWYQEARTEVNKQLNNTIIAQARPVEELVKQAAETVRKNIIPKYK